MRAAWAWLRRLGRPLTGTRPRRGSRGRARVPSRDADGRSRSAAARRSARPSVPRGCGSAAPRRSGKRTGTSRACRPSTRSLQDLRHAARGLRRDSRFTLIAIADAHARASAPRRPSSASSGACCWTRCRIRSPTGSCACTSPTRSSRSFPWVLHGLLAYRHENHTLSGSPATSREDLQLAMDSRPERLRGLQVSSNYFQVLGVLPARGRAFTWAEERKNANVAILSDAVWRIPIPGDPAVVGRAAAPERPPVHDRRRHAGGLRARRRQRIGALRRAKRWTCGGRCRSNSASERKGWHYINAVARLKPGVTAAQAQADLAAVSAAHPRAARTPGMFAPCRCWTTSWA